MTNSLLVDSIYACHKLTGYTGASNQRGQELISISAPVLVQTAALTWFPKGCGCPGANSKPNTSAVPDKSVMEMYSAGSSSKRYSFSGGRTMVRTGGGAMLE